MVSEPRIASFDRETTEALRQRCAESADKLAGLLQAEPGRLVQTRLNLLVNNLTDQGLALYALGAPLDRVSAVLGRSVDMRLALLRGRAPSDGFRVVDVRMLQASGGAGPSAVVTSRPEDWSVGNANFGYETLTMAIALGRFAQAREIASLIWDPPDPPYVGRGKYALYDFDQQRLAYAARRFVLGEPGPAIDELEKVRAAGAAKLGDYTAAQVDVLLALSRKDGSAIAVALERLAREHAARARSIQNRNVPDYFLCLPALAWGTWAITEGLADLESFSWVNGHAPRALIVYALASASGCAEKSATDEE